jgi:hypothetical protein
MAKLDLVYIGKFTIKDLNINSIYKFKNGELNIKDINRDNLLDKSQNHLDRCEYAVFVNGGCNKILKHIKI